MIDFFDPYGIRESARAHNAQRKIHNLEDADARADRLLPDVIAYWTGVITHVQGTVTASERPCSYKPWRGALREYSRKPPYIGELPPESQSMSVALMGIAQDVANPGWPTARDDLIEFSLVFLEADIMLFRSGYVKRHLIKRLQQSDLSDVQIARLDVLIRRAVTDGAGLEEYGGYCKVASSLVSKGHLPDLIEWLEHTANGAIITLHRADVETWTDILSSPHLSEKDRKKLMKVNWFGPSRWGVVYPEMRNVVDTRIEMVGPGPKSRKNAYLMLHSIRKGKKTEQRVG